MKRTLPAPHRKLLAAIVRRAALRRPLRAGLPAGIRGHRLARFIREYYAGVQPADLLGRTPEQLAGLAIAHLKLALTRRARAQVRLFNPRVREHGYVSPHTVIEVINDDMPFLVDSVGLVLTRHAITLHFLAHPVFAVTRDRGGALLSLHTRDGPPSPLQRLESWQHLEVDRIVDPLQLRSLQRDIEAALDDVRAACADWRKMQAAARRAARALGSAPVRFDARNVAETRALLDWMQSRHFLFLGYREYRLRGAAGRESLEAQPRSGLGTLRAGRTYPDHTGRIRASDIRRQSRTRDLALVTKANVQSTVHRLGHLDYVGIKHFDASGRLVGERRFLGLWTSAAYSTHPRDIPLVRHKVSLVIAHFGFPADSHDGKALQHILEVFPRDELFQSGVRDLVRAVSGILGLQDRPRVRVLLRRDPFRRFYSCLIFVPREKYNSVVRARIEALIVAALAARSVESQVYVAESNLARLHLVARTLPSARPPPSASALESRIAAALRSWSDEFKDALLVRFDETAALALHARYADALPAAYTEDFPGAVAALDVSCLEAMSADPERLHLTLYRPAPRRKDRFFLKVFRWGEAIAIADLVPMLENLGLKVIAERPYELNVAPQRRAWIQDLELLVNVRSFIPFERLEAQIEQAIAAVWAGRTDNDGFNQLTLTTGASWRQVGVLRAYCRYLLQAGLPFSQGYIAQVLTAQTPLVQAFIELFETRFDPQRAPAPRRAALARLARRIVALLEQVTGSDEDRILRSLWDALSATVRTNAFQTTPAGEFKDYLSLKFESQRLRELPQPRPKFDVFVFSTRMEGIHLRMGHVARGGIRWSDRREDFRTEVLGLMKAQQVKNTVIVPVGAKGGFVVRRTIAGDRDAQLAEGIACYQTLIRGMLDITDNIVGEKIVGPPGVVRHDGDDAYLVVAADKGTATFSDIANALSREYGFWLDDAFASGGSAGYDHKRMAITARGAWECVKRHFREIGTDIQQRAFSVVGIGDMAGDVFGNGMLQSPCIRLLAAFNHQHIFIDPKPDARRSFEERARLYALPRSAWTDYSAAALSPGGAIYPRHAKSLSLSREAQTLLDLPDPTTPNEVIKAILRAPVDLLWNGGIGTYVKSAAESHADVGDRSNDAVRIDGRELRCKVVGEGGNLGLTQRGRIEYARRGGRLNTDFIDNSAGVNCSDIEVNLKILLNGLMRQGALPRSGRDRLLRRMTDEVAALVLRNNVLQGQAISSAEALAGDQSGEDAYIIRALERAGDVDRALEFLPTEEDLIERRKAGEGLTRPELAVILSYGKIWLYQALIRSDVPEDSYLSGELVRYFPGPIRRRFAGPLRKHPLRREIIATAITNSLINRMGAAFPIRAQDDTGASPAEISRAYSIAREVFAVRELWSRIEALDNVIPAAAQYAAMARTSRLLRHASYWFLENRRGDLDIERAVRRYGAPVANLMHDVNGLLGATRRVRVERLRSALLEQRFPDALATRIAVLDALHCALDLVETARTAGVDIAFAAAAYFDAAEHLGCTWIGDQIESLPADGHWQTVARATLNGNLFDLQRRITEGILGSTGSSPAARLARWLRDHADAALNLKRIVADLRAGTNADFATLSVVLQAVRRLVGKGVLDGG